MIKITDSITVKDVLTQPETCIDYFNLVYVNDFNLTIKRVKKGDKFNYEKENILISDENILKRINQLVLPPMWKNVRISDLENGHLQAIGRDAKGRKQYKYHLNWNAIRNKTKFFKMVDFGKNLPKIRKQVDIDLKQKDWTLNKVLALIVKLLEETHIRIGNQQYAKRNKTYGLTTLRSRHITKDENKIPGISYNCADKKCVKKMDDSGEYQTKAGCQLNCEISTENNEGEIQSQIKALEAEVESMFENLFFGVEQG